MKKFYSMDDFDFKGKKVIVRIDLNSPVINGGIEENERFEVHARTVRELSDKGAKVILLAHQGSPGKDDFLPLEKHAELFKKHVKRKVKYVSDLIGKQAQKEINKLKEGKIILLENTKFLAEETLEKTPEELAETLFVKTLSEKADFFVNDAFSVSHRNYASITGFPQVLKSCAGRTMEAEVNAVLNATEGAQKPVCFLLGGGKPDDCIQIMEAVLEKGIADVVLTSGVLGKLLLLGKGIELTKEKEEMEKNGFSKNLPKLIELIKKYENRIETPIDLAFEEDGERIEIGLERINQFNSRKFFDIGSRTIERYSDIIKNSKTVYMKGPPGVYENPLFEKGTKAILKAIASSKAFSIIGGGHTSNAAERLGFKKKKFSHVSTAGGALATMLAGGKMPGIEELNKNFEKKTQSQ